MKKLLLALVIGVGFSSLTYANTGNDDKLVKGNYATKIVETKMNFEEQDVNTGCAYSYNVVVIHCDGTRDIWNAGLWEVPCGSNPDGHFEVTYLRAYDACD